MSAHDIAGLSARLAFAFAIDPSSGEFSISKVVEHPSDV